jgi:hypothetical protein
MKKLTLISLSISASIVVFAAGAAISTQDKHTVKVPNGLAFSEFRGYEDWPVIAISENGGAIAVIVGNPAMIDAYREGVPGDGKLTARRSDLAAWWLRRWRPADADRYRR